MKAVRLHEFHSAPVVEEVADPTIAGPLDVIVKIGGAGVCRTDQVCRPLLASGTTPERLRELTLADLPPSRELDRLRQRRAELGLPAGDDALLLIDPETGAAVTADAVPLHLRRARVTQVGIEANTSMCTGMLAHRYPTANGGLREVRDPGGPEVRGTASEGADGRFRRRSEGRADGIFPIGPAPKS